MKVSSFTSYIHATALGLALVPAAVPVRANAEGALYTTDNAATNHVLVFKRDDRGALTSAGSFATGGAGVGSAKGLPSQGAVVLSPDSRWLFVCNGGSDEISVFDVADRELRLTDKVASGGEMPISLTFHGNLLYVLNAGGYLGGTDNITGFVFRDGSLNPLAESTRTLSAAETKPAQVLFAPDGKTLVVTEQVTDLIDTFEVNDKGVAADEKSFASAGVQPFGFNFGRENRVFVSEAAGGMSGGSTTSSYNLSEQGNLSVISAAVPTHQTAACWALVSRGERFVYIANAGSGAISGFKIAGDGSLALVTASGATGLTGAGSHPTDMVESDDRRFLFSLNNGNGTISAFHTEPDGSLEALTPTSGLPTTAAGLVGR